MDSHKPSASTHRDGRMVVYRCGSEAVQDVNRQIEDVLGGVRTSPAARITDVVGVQDLEAEASHMILSFAVSTIGRHLRRP